MSEHGHPRHIALVGLMGVGKSPVGWALAQELGWAFDDNDQTIQQQRGETVRLLAEQLGVPAMHEIEAQHLLHALSGTEQSVLCAAASTIEDERCRQALLQPDVYTVWLTDEPVTLAERVAQSVHRPQLADDPEQLLRDQMKVRGPLFAEVADIHIVMSGRPADEIARELATAIF